MPNPGQRVSIAIVDQVVAWELEREVPADLREGTFGGGAAGVLGKENPPRPNPKVMKTYSTRTDAVGIGNQRY